jgi:RecA/RadA recombinase
MATKPFDVSKFRKSITKSIDGISVGFNDPTDWISTNNYALNYLISGAFDKGIPLGKVVVFAGESGAGKSFICSGNIVANAQKQGIFPILIDTENALDEKWLHALNVDTSEDKLLKLNMAMIDDVAKMISEFVKEYKTLPEDARPKVLFVLDSLGMLLTPTDVNQFNAGDMKGDMGRKPKALTALVRNCVNMFGDLNLGLVATNHTYASQDMFDPDDKISGGQGFIYASSIVVAMRKLKLKEDEDGNKVSEVKGIRAACKIMKTRYAKPFESVQVKIPYETGMNPYSGLLDLIEAKEMVKKEGNSLVYTDSDGVIIKKFRKGWERNDDGCLDKVMADITANPHIFDKVTLVEEAITGEDGTE